MTHVTLLLFVTVFPVPLLSVNKVPEDVNSNNNLVSDNAVNGELGFVKLAVYRAELVQRKLLIYPPNAAAEDPSEPIYKLVLAFVILVELVVEPIEVPFRYNTKLVPLRTIAKCIHTLV